MSSKLKAINRKRSNPEPIECQESLDESSIKNDEQIVENEKIVIKGKVEEIFKEKEKNIVFKTTVDSIIENILSKKVMPPPLLPPAAKKPKIIEARF